MTDTDGSCDISNQIVCAGQGKFSYVFKARQTADNKLIALKLIKIFDMDNESQRDTCLKEVQLHQVSFLSKSFVVCEDRTA